MPTGVLESAEMSWAERLKSLRLRAGYTQEQMADHLGLTRVYYWQLENGEHTKKTPGTRLQRDIELLEGTKSFPPPSPKGKIQPAIPAALAVPARGDVMRDVRLEPAQYLPVISYSQMGALTSYDEIPKDWQEFEPVGKVPDPKAFIVILKGDSMKGRYDEGDRAILLPSSQPRQGGPVVARLRDGSTICKFYNREGDEITFTSANKKYKPIKVHASEVAWIYPIYRVIKSVWN